MSPEGHLSIGEVLALLQEEFPDATVSKIRFLESQGLIAPERTPSGYRKFHEPDVERLRWILRQQKEHYLPLKVIKGRLAQLDAGDDAGAAPGAAARATAPAAGRGRHAAAPSRDRAVPQTLPVLEASGSNGDELSAGVSGASLTREELAAASGLEPRALDELDRYGLLPAPRPTASGPVYDEEALVIARLARRFMEHGVEARHLRMFKTFAEREAGFVEQLVVPILRQRNPDARQRARETVTELARLGSGLRAAMLRVALRGTLDE